MDTSEGNEGEVAPRGPATRGRLRSALLHAAALCYPLASCALAACSAEADWSPELLGDLSPPVLSSVRALDSQTVELRFDEPVSLVAESLLVDPALEGGGAESVGPTLRLTLSGQVPGTEYRLGAIVEDSNGNTLSLVAAFWGHNPAVPRLLINEITPRGSGSHPDLVEIKVLTDGDMGGVTLYQGTPGDWTDRLVFPSFRVPGGSFVVVHFRPEGTPEECDETEATDLSGGLDATPHAFDFWVLHGQGLSGNNGVLSLYADPAGAILDGLLYSNRTSDSDSAYGGFGSAPVLRRATELVEQLGWRAAGERVRPEDAVSPEGSTGTRSVARSSTSVDTNTAGDWHITPTRGATFGKENSDEVYVRPPPRGP